jgi:hypothetical protein
MCNFAITLPLIFFFIFIFFHFLTLIPALDDLADTDPRGEGLVAVERGVEFATVAGKLDLARRYRGSFKHTHTKKKKEKRKK